LIDRENYHLFQPLLYQVATAALSPAHITTPVRAAFRDNARMGSAARHRGQLRRRPEPTTEDWNSHGSCSNKF